MNLLGEIKQLQSEIKLLRDHNDELSSEVENLKNRDNDAKSVVSSVEIRSIISDENDGIYFFKYFNLIRIQLY